MLPFAIAYFWGSSAADFAKLAESLLKCLCARATANFLRAMLPGSNVGRHFSQNSVYNGEYDGVILSF